MPDDRHGETPFRKRLAARVRLLPLALEAGFELILAAVLTRFPERWYFRRYRLSPAKEAEVAPDADSVRVRRAALAGHVVRRMAEVLPIRAVCLQQTLATCRMLRRRGMRPVAVFGLARDGASDGDRGIAVAMAEQGVDAHAWVEVEGIVANGGRTDLDRFRPVGRFC